MVLGMGITLNYAIYQEKKLADRIMADNIERLGHVAFGRSHTSMRLGGGMKENRAVMERLRE